MLIQLKKMTKALVKISGIVFLAGACLLPLTANSWIGFWAGPGWGYHHYYYHHYYYHHYYYHHYYYHHWY